MSSTDSLSKPASSNKYRLITRSDFDGVVSAVLLKELDMIDDVLFVHPKDMQDGKIEVTNRDILTNLPYHPDAHLVFDHHASETMRVYGELENHVIEAEAPSAARVVYNYYGGKFKFPHIPQDMMTAVDKCDAAQFDLTDILEPQGWVLLSFLMDSRTGLGRFRDFRISNYALMMQLVEACRHQSITEIMQLPDVVERLEMYLSQDQQFRAQIQRCARFYGSLVVLDLLDEEVIYAGNRFMVYALFPECNISMHIMWGKQKQNIVFAVGKSVINRTNPIDIGQLMLQYEGGGHQNAGTCQVPHEYADAARSDLISFISANA
ncbi:MAG: exopolyphosphatase [Pseudanabaenaceae cyanobacterium]|jgi:nanoRNase/pAp phosphatase (c-di-AMP/oligoRNAs hydrolase)